MARLNIDFKKLPEDRRFAALLRTLGPVAWERYIRFSDIAQDWYAGKAEGAEPLDGIPEDVFALEGDLEPLVEVGLASRSPDDGRIHSHDEQKRFGWLLGKRAGGLARADQERDGAGRYVGGQLDDSSLAAGGADQQPASSQPAAAGQLLDPAPSSQPASSSLSFSTSLLKHSPKPPQIAGATKQAEPSRRDQVNAAWSEVRLLVLGIREAYLAKTAKADIVEVAEGRLTPLAKALVLSCYPSWHVCCREFYAACDRGRREKFESTLKSSFRSNLDKALSAVGCRDGPDGENAHQDRDEPPSAGDFDATEGLDGEDAGAPG